MRGGFFRNDPMRETPLQEDGDFVAKKMWTMSTRPLFDRGCFCVDFDNRSDHHYHRRRRVMAIEMLRRTVDLRDCSCYWDCQLLLMLRQWFLFLHNSPIHKSSTRNCFLWSHTRDIETMSHSVPNDRIDIPDTVNLATEASSPNETYDCKPWSESMFAVKPMHLLLDNLQLE
jgi:hypothetical protein